MKDLVSISKYGSISVLGVSIGCRKQKALDLLEGYNFLQNDRCVYKPNFLIGDFPPGNITYSLDEEKYVSRIRIYVSNATKEECERLYRHFYRYISSLSQFCKTSESKIDVSTVSVTFSNDLHDIKLLKQIDNAKNPNFNPCYLEINARLLSCDKNLIRSLYTNKESVIIPKRSVIDNNFINKKNIIIAIAFIFLLIILYLYLNNYRYMIVDDNYVFDKWKGQIVL